MHTTRCYFVQVGVAGCGLVQDEPFHTGLRPASCLRVSPAKPLLYFYSSGPEATEQTKTTPHRGAAKCTHCTGTQVAKWNIRLEERDNAITTGFSIKTHVRWAVRLLYVKEATSSFPDMRLTIVPQV
ncbi:hypothetical protein NDU88_001364 [Pleurodeles waltl]|uniref:Uncharacterized protein n=1 Tax=Pleurodeles waltl TaxID=8319 RepID=A0AAV7VZ73_PLEWA|nr:hypothetical protein NDU88_001364 [Pleurodeles waltl]